MSELYNKYFGSGDIDQGKTDMMLDIECHKLSGAALNQLIDELERQDLLLEKPFEKKPESQWDTTYLAQLSYGAISYHFSREYLQYFARVADFMYKKNQPQKKDDTLKKVIIAGAAAAAVIAVVAVAIALS